MLLALVAALAAAHPRAPRASRCGRGTAWWDPPTSTPARAGLQVLQHGGNAIDAAVAVGFALAVTHPAAGNLGGGGFMVIRMADGRETTIDYREMAPAAAHRDMFLDERGRAGAGAQPRRPAGLGRAGLGRRHWRCAQRRYGRLPLAEVIAPAIALARDGFEVSWALADSLKSAQSLLAKFPSSARAFRRADGTLPGRRRSPGAARPRQHARAHRGAGARRVLQGRRSRI